MDDEHVRDYTEPCPRCSEVNWGITDEGKFYCQSCHTVIERSKEVTSADTFTPSARISSVSRGIRGKRKVEQGRLWYLCEGFQFILTRQADAIKALGVCAQFKDKILCSLWRLYLHKSQQAYTDKPIQSKFKECYQLLSSGSESNTINELSSFSESENGSRSPDENSDIASESKASSLSDFDDNTSLFSGSIDGSLYKSFRKGNQMYMSMPMTLAFCYLSLLWLRESMTLSELLKYVADGQIPYLNMNQFFPEEIKLYGMDLHIFYVQKIPTYNSVQQCMVRLAWFLGLPGFPQITEHCYFHPNILCIKYLMEANLPDEMHTWICRLAFKTGISNVASLTFNPTTKQAKPIYYEVKACALIIVMLKLLFQLDDVKEWCLSEEAETCNMKTKGVQCFSFQKWYETMSQALEEAKQKEKEKIARKSWKLEKPFYYIPKQKYLILKKRRFVNNLEDQFAKLSGSEKVSPTPVSSSFQFVWNNERGQKSCFHGHTLNFLISKESKQYTFLDTNYWYTPSQICKQESCQGHFYLDVERLPKSCQFVLSLFCFLLKVEMSTLYQEVTQIEQKLVQSKGKRNLHREIQKLRPPKPPDGGKE
uniref:TATA box-binding protein-associated factor RNA polymerase I subunit B n=1 Tax=Erpetoichthys calabaricus TaxID=27687 RepID=A0A8C4SAJ7_ERPCA